MASSPYPRHPYEIRRRAPNPKSAALLVIDVQKHFSSVALPILPALNATIDLCRAASVPVILTRHCHTSPSDSPVLAEWWGASDLILEGTPASEFLPGLARHDGDRVFEKDTYSAFRGTGLEEALREMGVEEVIVTGVMTNLCCETSAREAFVRGFRVFFSTDATGTSNRDLQDSTIKNMAYGFAYLVDCARLKAAFSPAMTDKMTSSLPVYPYEVHKRDPNPKISALLVIDMQNHFSSVALPILSALNTTIKLCRAASIPIIFTRHRHKSFSDYAMLGEWWGHADLILDGTPASELLPGLARCDGDLIIEKYTYSAFHGTGLEEALKRMGVEEVIVTGVMTNLCCETSAREAFVSGFRVFFSTDATGTANRDLQESTVKNMAYGFAYLMDCGRLKVAFSGEVNTRPVAPMISIEEKAVGTSNGIEIGMEFDTFEEAYTYCQTFAHQSGFEYTLRNTNYETTGDKRVRRAKLGCSRAGIAPVKPTDPFYNRRLSSKTNCRAFVRIRLCGGAKYVIVAMTNEHNHGLLDESMMKYLQTKKNSSVGKKKRSKKHE